MPSLPRHGLGCRRAAGKDRSIFAQPAALSSVWGYGPKATAHERDLAALRTIELEKEGISMWYDTLKYLVELLLGLFGL